ncbi:hypothetical protein MRX96_020207 [Rhipicephalus microplus]
MEAPYQIETESGCGERMRTDRRHPCSVSTYFVEEAYVQEYTPEQAIVAWWEPMSENDMPRDEEAFGRLPYVPPPSPQFHNHGKWHEIGVRLFAALVRKQAEE